MIRIGGHDIQITGRLPRIGRLDTERYETLEQPEALLAQLRRPPALMDLFTFLAIRPEPSRQYPYVREWDNLAVLPVSTFDHWWKHQLRSVARNRARQAEKKGVVLREVSFDDALCRGIQSIYNESPLRQGRRFPHYGKTLGEVRAMTGTYLESSYFLGAYLEEQLIGFAKLTCDQTRTQANLMSILARIEHRDKAPANALIAHAVRLCAQRGITSLVYQRYDYGKGSRDSLTEFKDNNGFSRVDVPRYWVPVTGQGALALRLGLHRRLRERCPEAVATRLLSLRSAWQARRLAKEAVAAGEGPRSRE